MVNKGKYIILLIGKSGSGKSTIAAHLEDICSWKSVQSYTTRKPRYSGETGHMFIDDKTFNKLYPSMCAYTEFDGHRYGATKQQIDENDIYVIDPAGVCDLVKFYRGEKILVPVYLSTSWLTRFKRMRLRGDGIVKIIKRLINDRKMFDKHISNNGCEYPMNWPKVISINANNRIPQKLSDEIIYKTQLYVKSDRKKVSDA